MSSKRNILIVWNHQVIRQQRMIDECISVHVQSVILPGKGLWRRRNSTGWWYYGKIRNAALEGFISKRIPYLAKTTAEAGSGWSWIHWQTSGTGKPSRKTICCSRVYWSVEGCSFCPTINKEEQEKTVAGYRKEYEQWKKNGGKKSLSEWAVENGYAKRAKFGPFGGSVDIHKATDRLPKPKRGWTLPEHKYTGPYNPLDKQ